MRREDLEAEPAVASAIFGQQLELARRFTADLAQHGEEMGLIGPLELPRLWSRHVINSALLSPLLWRGARVGDVGSGAGLPGLVLAIARPDVRFVLVEPMERRTEWLLAESARLDLSNVEIVRSRAEDAEISPWLDQVTARAVSSLTKLIPITSRLLRSGGQLLLLKGAGVEAEVAAAEKVIRRLRLESVGVQVLGEELVPDVTRVFTATTP